MNRRLFFGGLSGILGAYFLFGGKTKGDESNLYIPEDDFERFFETVNGFSMNENQKLAYEYYKCGETSGFTGKRQTGMSVLMITLAHWESLKGKKVLVCSTNLAMALHHVRMLKNQLINKEELSKMVSKKEIECKSGGRVSFTTVCERFSHQFVSKKLDNVFLSCDGRYTLEMYDFSKVANNVINRCGGRYFEIGTREIS